MGSEMCIRDSHNTAVFRYINTVVNNSCAVVVAVTPRNNPGKFRMERSDFGVCGQVDCGSTIILAIVRLGPWLVRDGSLNTKFHTPHRYEHT